MAGRQPRGRATASNSSAPLERGIGDNGGDHEEVQRIQFISILSKLSQADDDIAAAKVPLEAAQAARKKIIGLGKAAGLTADDLNTRLKEMRTPVREMARKVATERQQRRWSGIIDADQESLVLGDAAPQSAKDEVHWAGEGYKAGLRQMPPTAPPGCTGPNAQVFLKGHERGWKEVLEANAPKKLPSVRDKAAADFAKDHPEPGTPEAKKAEREAMRKAKESLDAMKGPDAVTEIVDNDPLGIGEQTVEAGGEAPPVVVTGEEAFEATEEELAAQSTRAAVRETESVEVV